MKRISSRIAYQNPWMTVREDTLRRSDGSTGIYGVVDKPDFALVMPRQHDGFWLVEQYRYPVERRAWEFPQGSWSAGTSGEPADLARAELAEETGLLATEVSHVGHLYIAYGFSSQGFDVFLATGLTSGRPSRESTEQDMVHRFVTDEEFRSMLVSGAIVDAATVAAYSLLMVSSGADHQES